MNQKLGRVNPTLIVLVFTAMANWSCSCPDGPGVSLPIELSGSGRLSLGQSIDSLDETRILVEGDYTKHTYSEHVDSPLVHTILYEECSSRVMSVSASGQNISKSERDSVERICRRIYGPPRNKDSLGSSPLFRQYGWDIGDKVYAELVLYPLPKSPSNNEQFYSYILVLMYRGFEGEPI